MIQALSRQEEVTSLRVTRSGGSESRKKLAKLSSFFCRMARRIYQWRCHPDRRRIYRSLVKRVAGFSVSVYQWGNKG